MTSIKGRDRQDVHKGENDAEEGGHHPELMPVPDRREKRAYCTETSQRLGAISRSHILQVTHIATQHIETKLDTGWETLEESIFHFLGFIVGCDAGLPDAEFQIFCKNKIDGVVALVDAIGGWLNVTNGDTKEIYVDHTIRTIDGEDDESWRDL